MNLPVLCNRPPGWPAALAIAGLTTGLAFGEQNDQALESAPAPNTIVATNASRQQSRKLKDDLFKRKLTEELFRSFQPSGNSLEGMLPAPPQIQSVPTPQQARRLKEMRDREKYWLFLSSDEYLRDQTSESELHNADSDSVLPNLGTSSVLERFYRSLDRSRLAGTNASVGNPFSSRDKGDAKQPGEFGLSVTDLRDGTKTVEDNPIKALYEASSPREVRVPSPSFFSDIFVPSPIPLERTKAEKERISEFNKILEGPGQSASSRSPLNSLSASSVSPLAPSGSLDSLNGLPSANSLAGQLPGSIMSGSITKPLGASSLLVIQPNEPQTPTFKPVSPPRRQF